VVAELQRLSRSTTELGTLMEWFQEANAALVALDLGVDTSTPAGHDVAATLITLSGWERERIARRTRSGLAEVGAQGGIVGRPAVSDAPELTERIAAMRAAGMTLQAIADQLNAEGVATLRGGAMWQPSSVQAALGYRRPSARGPEDQLPSLGEDHPH
jgi:DNA invertase Pin-like site-specific DNA recombinase